MKNLIYKYLVYIVYFLGAGLTSSGIVLMPFNSIRYSIILSIGLGLFVAGSMFNELVVDRHSLSTSESAKLIGLSLSLAIGIGMISGGISHFKESPVYVSYLIPTGVVISFISYILKSKTSLSRAQWMKVSIGVFALALILHGGLSISATNMAGQSPGGDIFQMSH